MKKAIKSKYTESVTTIERADWSIKFYDVETGRHYERRVWFPVHGSDIYVQHRGGFYSITTEYEGRYDPQAISRYEAVSAEELEVMTAEIIAHRAGIQYADALTWEEATRVYAYAIICKDADEYATMSAVVSGILQDSSKQPERIEPAAIAAEAMNETNEAMSEASEAERKTIEAAISYDPEAAAKYAKQAEEAAQRAEAAADRAASMDPTTADVVYEEAEFARAYADRATETAEANARELKQRAEIIAAIEDDQERHYIETEATAHQWSPDEARDNIEYRANIRTANAAAAALVSAYAEAIGEYPEDDDPETIAAGNVAAAEIIGNREANAADLETVADMLEAIANHIRSDAEDRAAWARNEAIINASKAAKDPSAAWRKVFVEAAQEAARKARAFATVAGTEAAQEAAQYAEDAARRAALTKYAGMKYLELEPAPAPAPTYQRHELEAYLGEPDAYDVEAIEAEATAYDPKSGARVWSAFGEDLAAIAERHELYEYAPAV